MSSMNFPTKEEFIGIFNLFPKGNPEKVYTDVKYIMMSKKTFTGDPITWDLISNAYSAYIDKRKKEGVQDMYIKSLESFCNAGDYNIDFNKEPSMEKKDMFQTGMDSTMDELEKRLGYKK